jgi:hypothetical protein
MMVKLNQSLCVGSPIYVEIRNQKVGVCSPLSDVDFKFSAMKFAERKQT